MLISTFHLFVYGHVKISVKMSPIFGKPIFKILSYPLENSNNVWARRLISIFKKSTKVKELTPYIILRAKMEEFQDILRVMHESYYPEEPTLASLNITPNPLLDEKTIKAMSEGFTLVAKCKYTGCIVGACINASTSPWDPEVYEKLACSVQADNVQKVLIFYAHLMRAPDLWRCLDVQKVYEISHLFVKKAHRKKGIAYRLVEESKALGADAGFSVIRCDATNAHTARICERIGMQKVQEIPYCSYLDQNLEPIFKPPWPHESVQIFCDCAPQASELAKKIKKTGSLCKTTG